MPFSRRPIILVIATTLFIAPGNPAWSAEFLMVVDSSGSMQEPTRDGETKINAAKHALAELKADLQAHQVGIMIFGHRTDPKTDGCCQDVEVALPISSFEESNYDAVVANLSPRGATPLAESLSRAGEHLGLRDREAQKILVVVTDGNDTCGGDPISEAAKLRAQGINVTIHVVGFGVKPDEIVQLQQLAKAGGGKLGLAETRGELGDALRAAAETVPPVVLKLSPVESALVSRFDDEDHEVRRSAAETLLKMKAMATLPILHQRVVVEPEYYAWRAAVTTMIGLSDQHATTALIKATQFDNAKKRKWAAEWLPSTSNRSKNNSLNDADQTLVKLLADENHEVRRSAAHSLLIRKAIGSTMALYKRVQIETEYYAWREAIVSLKGLDQNKAIESIVEALSSEDKNTRKWAADWAADVSAS